MRSSMPGSRMGAAVLLAATALAILALYLATWPPENGSPPYSPPGAGGDTGEAGGAC